MDQPDRAGDADLAHPESLHGRLTEGLLHIHHGEGRHVALLFVQLFASSGVFILGRTVRDTLFLSRYPVAYLPWMFVFYGIGAALVSLFYSRYADRISRSVLLYVTSGVGILTYFAVWILVRIGVALVYPLFYVWSEIVSTLAILQFWTLASELDHSRDARRLNTTIGAARPLGVVFFGFGTGWFVRFIGTEQLMFVLILLLGMIAACTRLLRNQPRIRAPGSVRESKPRGEGLGKPLEKKYFRSISLLMLIMFLALTLGDFQFKIIARACYTEDSLAQFFSLFYGIVGILSIGFQLFLTPAILAKLGVGAALTVMPGVFGTSSALLLLWPGLAAACSLKFSDNGLQFTLHDTTMQSLYSPFPAAARGRTRAFLDGAIKPLSYGAGGLLLVILVRAHLDVRQISFVTIPLAIAWLALVPFVRRGYLKLLEKGLAGPMAGQLFTDPFVIGTAERRILVQILETGDPASVAVALEQLQNDRSSDFRQALRKLLRHTDSGIRARAIRILDLMEESSAMSDFAAAARDGDAVVRAAAAAALARLVGDDNPDQILHFLDDPSREVRVQALACLVRYGGLEGATRAGDRLLGMISSEDPEQRREACLVLSRLGHLAYLSLKRLLQDPEARVRRAAMRAASGTADPHLVPAIIRGLYDPPVWKTATSALVAVGEAAVTHIEQAMRDPLLPRAVRLQLPRVLSRIPSAGSFVALRDLQEDTDSHFRLRVYAALGRLRLRLGYAPTPPRLLVPRVRREVLEVWGNLHAWNSGRGRFGTSLLIEEMDFRKKRAERRILRLLEMSYGLREIGLILAAMQDSSRREEALDALEAILDASLRDLVIPALESLGPGPARPPVTDPNVSVLPPVQFMLLQAYHPNTYVNFLALDALARAGEVSALPAAQNALMHSDPLVREAGLHALARLDRANSRTTAAALRADPDPTVARWAHFYSRSAANPAGTTATVGESMHDTFEKILFLKGTPIFSRLPGEDLAPLARVAEVIHFEEGDAIIKEGEFGDYFYVVISGLVVLECEGTVLREVGPPGMIGELAVLDRGAQSSSARALKPSDLLRIGADEFFEILHEQAELAETLIRILAGEVRQAQRRLIEQNRGHGTS
jgi:ATP/ADP translocase/HEAT repeat protein